MDSAARPLRPDPRRPSVIAIVVLVATLLWGGVAASVPRHPKVAPAVATGEPAPDSMDSATGVSCANPQLCVAVGLGNGTTAAIDVTTNGGRTWHPEAVPSSVNALASVSCSTPRDCLAVGSAGSAGAVLSTVDGGTTWNLATVPVGSAVVTAVQCPARLRCVVLATDGMTYWASSTADFGTTWVRGGTLPAGMSATGLFCASPDNCLASGFTPTTPGHGAGAIAATSDGGGTWTPATLPSGLGVLRSVTCAGSTCLSAGTASTATTGFVPGNGELLTSLDSGTTWRVTVTAPNGNDAFAAACPSARTCLVAGTEWLGKTTPDPTGSITTTIDGGQSWQRALLHYVPVGLASVSCPAVDSCEAVGGNVFVRIALPVKVSKPRRPASPANRVQGGIR